MLELKDPALLRQEALIGGKWSGASTRFAVRNPANAALLAELPKLGANEAALAIAAAKEALPAWRARPARERAQLLRGWYELTLQHQDDLAAILTAEQGKPLAEARAEIAYGASYIEWFAEEARRAYGQVLPRSAAGKRVLVTREAIGVCAAITPWNFPHAMVTRKLAPALAAGCSVVLKPAEQAPLSALALGELALRAGIPAGVINIINGDAAAIGRVLCASAEVRKLSFTGSTAVGRLLMAQCAPTIKKLSLELGGNAPFIVFADADLDAAVAGAIASKFRNAGQTCVCANRLLVQQEVLAAFTAKLAEAVAKFKLGEGSMPGVSQGPLINAAAVQKMEALLADATALGAQIICGGRPHALGGNFFEPTVLCGATRDMRLAREEIFGPVAPIFAFADEAEALALANDTEYGLAAYVYTRDHARIWRLAEALEYAMVGINTGIISSAEAPFGGLKQSGLGREGGAQGIDEYLETKSLCWGEG